MIACRRAAVIGFTLGLLAAAGTANWTVNYYSIKDNKKLTCSVTPGTVACPSADLLDKADDHPPHAARDLRR